MSDVEVIGSGGDLTILSASALRDRLLRVCRALQASCGLSSTLTLIHQAT